MNGILSSNECGSWWKPFSKNISAFNVHVNVLYDLYLGQKTSDPYKTICNCL